jgi:uncharacterized SAM-binding protein YcdF (DUF218 family)
MLAALAVFGASACRAAWADERSSREERAFTADVEPRRAQPTASVMSEAHFRAWGRELLWQRAQLETREPSVRESESGVRRASVRESEPVALNALVCRGWRQRRAEAPLGECAGPMVDRVKQWSPDALVVLGGGLQLDGQPNCATAERGFIAAQLFTALESRPLLVFTGHASRWIRRRVDAEDVRCIRARLAQGPLGEDVPAWAREQGEPSERALYAVSEAESMCAVMLRALPEAQRDAVLERARFDVRARDTVENARYTREFLIDAQVERALVVTSPFINPSNWRYYPHADRALHAFRSVRRDAPYALAALACPRSMKRAPWFEFERVDGYDGPLRSRDLRDEAATR